MAGGAAAVAADGAGVTLPAPRLLQALLGTAVDNDGFAVVGFGIAILYLLFQDGLGQGQSLGKRMVRTRVIDERTLCPGNFWQSFVRNLLLSFLGLIDWIFIFGEKRQRLGDMLAHTLVVRAE